MASDLERKAREMLVDAYTKAGATQRAQHIRCHAVDWPDTIAIAAIVSALRAVPAAAGVPGSLADDPRVGTAEHKMPEPVAWRCNWNRSGEIAWLEYHDETDPLPEKWDAPPNETLPLYSAETVRELQAEVERLRGERDALAKDAARYRWLRERWGRMEEIYETGTDNMLNIRDSEPGEGWRTDPATLDAAIDAAMAQSDKGSE